MNELLLVWNMGRNRSCPSCSVNDLGKRLGALVEEKRPSLLAIQEAPPGIGGLLPPGFQIETAGKGLATAFRACTWTLHSKEERLDRALALGIDHNAFATKLWFWNLHLAVLHKSDEQKKKFVRMTLRPEIERVRALAPERLDLIAGDFNLAPYSSVVLGEEGFFANRCLTWAYTGSAGGVVGRRLFNPTWQVFGRTGAPYGTYYRSEVGEDGPWHVSDQAVMSAELAVKERVQVSVVDTIGGVSLCSNSSTGAPSARIASDHLPLLVEFRA